MSNLANSTNSPNEQSVVWHPSAVSSADRPFLGATLWLTGLSGSGKSSLGVELEKALVNAGRPAFLLDGDNLRHGLTADLGFTEGDRKENIRRTAEVALLFAQAGVVVIVALISPFAAERQHAKDIHHRAQMPFYEIFIDTPLELCEQRDPKGMYQRARQGLIKNFTGIDSPYERPTEANRVVSPDGRTPTVIAHELLASLEF